MSETWERVYELSVDGSEIRRTTKDDDYPIIYRVIGFKKPSKRWLGMGFLNHQQYQSKNGEKNNLCLVPLFWAQKMKVSLKDQ